MCDLDPLRLWMVSVCVALDRAIGSGTKYIDMIGAVELGDGQPGRSVHSCIPYLQTSDLSPPVKPLC